MVSSFFRAGHKTLVHRRRGNSPTFFLQVLSYMNEISIFIDESGDFGPLEKHAQYYIVTLIIHE